MTRLHSLSDLSCPFGGTGAQTPATKIPATAEAARGGVFHMLTDSRQAQDAPPILIVNRNPEDPVEKTKARDAALDWLNSAVQRGRREIVTENVNVTPDLAALLLGRNPDNRNIRKRRVAEIRADMERGRFAMNGEPVIVAKDGLLNDGQHRLLACVESGIPFRTLIVFGVSRSSRLTLDQGNARTVADYLDMQGGIESTKIAATVGRMLWQHERFGSISEGAIRGRANGTKSWPTKAQIMDAVNEHDREIAEAIRTFPSGARIVGSHSFVAFCLIVLKRGGGVVAEAFLRQIVEGSNLSADSPVYILRERLIADQKLRQPDRFEAIVRTWNAVRKGRPLSKIQIMGNVPKIEG